MHRAVDNRKFTASPSVAVLISRNVSLGLQRYDRRAVLCGDELFLPPVEQFHPPCEPLAAVVGASYLVVVRVIEGEFHYVSAETLIAGQGREGAPPSVRAVFAIEPQRHAVHLFDGLPADRHAHRRCKPGYFRSPQ